MRAPTLRLGAALALLGAAAPASAQLVPDDDVPGVLVETGYDLRLAVGGLTYPSNVTFGAGRAFVSESGFSPDSPPNVKELTIPETGTGSARIILTPAMLPPGRLRAPFTDVTYRDGLIYLAHLQTGVNMWPVGAVSRFNPDDPAGTFATILTGLPSTGDHQNNTVVFGPDGRAYFGQGSATNSGVVGADNVPRWAADYPGFSDTAPVAVTLNGAAFTARVPTSLDPDANAVTAPYRPFDTGAVAPGTVVPAATPAAPAYGGIVAGVGAVYSFDPAAADPAGTLRLEAWGLRNPFGLAFDRQDPTRLFISNNGSDIRGQAGNPNMPFDPSTFVVQGNRPVAQDYDEMFALTVGGEVEFFGWPEFFHDPETRQPRLASDPLFCQSPTLTAADCPQPIFDAAFRGSLVVQPAFSTVGLYVSVTGFEPSPGGRFGFEGDLFVTESGSFGPQTGAFTFTGYKVSRVNRETGAEVDFVVNQGTTPEELFVPEKLNKPVSAVFDGDRLAIVDLGVLEPGIDLFQSGTGKVWLLVRTGGTAGEAGAEALGTRLVSVTPNPAAGRAAVSFTLAEAADVRLSVLDVLGREVAVLAEGVQASGDHSASVETRALPAGVYVVRLAAGGRTETRRLTVVR